jgi:MFS family permease
MWDVKPFIEQVTEEDFKLLEQKNNGDVNKTKKITKMQREKNCCEDFIIVRVFCMIKWKLLWDPFFVVVGIGNSMVYCAVLSYVSQLRTICSQKGLSVPQTADIISVMAFTEIFTRLFQGFLGDRACIRNAFRHSKKMMYTFMGIGASAALIGITFAFDFVSLAICICVCSLFTSGVLINSPLIYSECFPDNLPSAIGLSNLFKAVIAIVLGPTTGMLNTHFGSFNAALYFLAGANLLCMGVWLVVEFIHFVKTRK